MRELELDEGDAAIIIRSDGEVILITPRFDEDDDVPDHIALISAIAMKITDDDFREEMFDFLDKRTSSLN